MLLAETDADKMLRDGSGEVQAFASPILVVDVTEKVRPVILTRFADGGSVPLGAYECLAVSMLFCPVPDLICCQPFPSLAPSFHPEGPEWMRFKHVPSLFLENRGGGGVNELHLGG